LSIAGSDNSAGAGIQADLKTISALGAYALTAVSCVVAEVPGKVSAIQGMPPALVGEQIRLCFESFPIQAVKTGMLYSVEILQMVVETLAALRSHSEVPPLVVDPVMVATSGHRLLAPECLAIYERGLFPHATVVTPNLDEAEILVGRPLKTVDDLHAAAVQIRLQYGCAALVKGGHLRGTRQATDVFFDGESGLTLSVPFVRGVATHGTGCAYSAAITGYLALGLPLPQAVEMAKTHITQAISQSLRIGKHTTLNPFWS
jgi:hydroxymethylpyrimidine/phosphomethylpyrimidine kinase